MSGVLLEARPFRPFKSSEEYLYAMKEDLAEWFLTLYPHLRINVDNFMDRLETGVALCEHANAVKAQAAEYVHKKQARKLMTRSVTGSLFQARQLVDIADVKFFATAKAGTFFARDNVSNFIHWCRQSLKIIECLLFETDDLILRKNEKHVILCLLEVARRGAKFGMLAPMLIQMERQIDREIAADQKKMGRSVGDGCEGEEDDDEFNDESDSEIEDEQPVLMYGPLPQIVTNDLKSLDEMVRDLVEKCTCPTQFPMIRVSEGKYRIGETKVLIFVRILRSHVMVRVGGGWDTLSHYLDKHDPCRCRSQHRTTQGARLINRPGAVDLQGAQVFYDRSLPTNGSGGTFSPGVQHKEYLGPPTNSLNRSRSRSPSSQQQSLIPDPRRSVSPNLVRKNLAAPSLARSRSPTPNFVSTHVMAKLSANKTTPVKNGKSPQQQTSSVQMDPKVTLKTEALLQVTENLTDHSDNASELSDEGYRSLGIIQNDKNGGNGKNRSSLYSQNSLEDAEETERQISIDYEDDTNDAGLRRTQFSHIYKENPLEKQTCEKTPEPQPTKPSTFVEKLSNGNNNNNKSGKLSKQSSFESYSPKKTIPSTRNISSAKFGNTWNGRQRASRPSIGSDTFSPPPFVRNSVGRRSDYSSSPRRSSSSTNTSPTKGKLKEELLRAMKDNHDDLSIAEQVRKVLKKYGSLASLNGECQDDEDDETLCVQVDGSPSHQVKLETFVTPRKDSRPDNNISRIPAPILLHRA